MPLCAAAIMPHGSEAIVELQSPNLMQFETITQGLSRAAEALSHYPATTAIVLTPHGIRAEGKMTISVSETVRGVIEEGVQRLEETFPVNQALARQIAADFKSADVDSAELAYGASSGPFCQLPMDWGAQVPLHFLAERQPNLTTVVMTPSRQVSLKELYRAGEILARTIEAWSEPVWLIASADMAHAHDPHGPYGYDPAAKAFDSWFVEQVRTQNWEALLTVDMDFVSHAKPDALWQAVILAGAIQKRWQGLVLGYDCPTYFGMMNAVFLPERLSQEV